MKAMQDATLSSLLAGDRAVRLMEGSSVGSNAYSVDELMTDLRSGIFSELKTKTSIDMYRRNLQKVMVDRVITLLNPGRALVRSVPVGAYRGTNIRNVDLAQTDLPSIARGHLISLRSELKASTLRMTDKLSRYHIEDLVARIDKGLNPNLK
jgi:Met-zincin